MKEIKEKLREMFNGIEIYPPFSPEPTKMTDYIWNKSMKDFEVTYLVDKTKYRLPVKSALILRKIHWSNWRKRFYI